MSRIARVVAPGYPPHVTQRGNRRQQPFFCDDDYLAYIELIGEGDGQRGQGERVGTLIRI
jgi:REP-associated tyrosine transposase